MAVDRTDLVDDLLKRWEALKDRRRRFEPVWQQIAELVHPQLADFDIDGESDDISYRLDTAFDATGRRSVRIAVSGMEGWLTPRSQPFFQIGVLNPGIRKDSAVRKWLKQGEEAVFAEFDNSNYYDAIGDAYEKGFTIATSSLNIAEDVKNRRVVYAPKHPKSIWIAQDQYGNVDTVFELQSMTWRQIAMDFGEDKIPETHREKVKQSPYEETQILRVCVPREDRIPGKRDKLNMPFGVYWILLDTNDLLRESGYRFMHDIVWRYRASQYDAYGFGPSWDAFLDLKRGNKFAETLLRAADYSVRPAIQYSGRDRNLNLNPAGMNPIQDIAAKIEKIDLVGNYPIGVDWYDRNVRTIEEHYRTRVFTAMMQTAQRQRTAFEVEKIAGEQAVLLQGEVGRTQSELLDPSNEATIRIMVDAGRFPEPPDIVKELAGGIRFEYVSPLSQLQREYHGVVNIQRFIRNALPILQISRESGDYTDWDKLLKEIMEQSHVDAETPEQLVRQIRTARAKANQQAGGIATAKELSEVAKNLDNPQSLQVFGALQGQGQGAA